MNVKISLVLVRSVRSLLAESEALKSTIHALPQVLEEKLESRNYEPDDFSGFVSRFGMELFPLSCSLGLYLYGQERYGFRWRKCPALMNVRWPQVSDFMVEVAG